MYTLRLSPSFAIWCMGAFASLFAFMTERLTDKKRRHGNLKRSQPSDLNIPLPSKRGNGDEVIIF